MRIIGEPPQGTGALQGIETISGGRIPAVRTKYKYRMHVTD
jgi:hypothetical protein